MAFSTQTFAYGSLLTSAKMTAMMDNDTFLKGLISPSVTAGGQVVHQSNLILTGTAIGSENVLAAYWIDNFAAYSETWSTVCPFSGTLRITFNLARYDLGGGAETAYAKIYRNGVAVGTERSSVSGTYAEYSEDISGWSAGDLIQIYTHMTTGLGLKYAVITLVTIAIANAEGGGHFASGGS